MAVDGVNHLFITTHNWGKTVAFWTELGFTLEDDFGGSGMLRPPAGGPYLFVEEVGPDAPLELAVYLGANDSTLTPKPPVEVTTPFTPTHWGTQVMDVRDPDGRILHIEAPG